MNARDSLTEIDITRHKCAHNGQCQSTKRIEWPSSDIGPRALPERLGWVSQRFRRAKGSRSG